MVPLQGRFKPHPEEVLHQLTVSPTMRPNLRITVPAVILVRLEVVTFLLNILNQGALEALPEGQFPHRAEHTIITAVAVPFDEPMSREVPIRLPEVQVHHQDIAALLPLGAAVPIREAVHQAVKAAEVADQVAEAL